MNKIKAFFKRYPFNFTKKNITSRSNAPEPKKMKNSLIRQMTLMLLSVVLIPVMVATYIASETATNALVSEAKAQLAESNIKTTQYFELILRQIENSRAQILVESEIKEFLKTLKEQSTEEAKKNIYRIWDNLKRVGNTNEYIDGIYIVSETGHLVGYPQIFGTVDIKKLEAVEWYQKVKKSNKPVWIDDHEEGIGKNSNSSAVKYITSYGSFIKDGRLEYAFLMDVNEVQLKKALETVHRSDNIYRTYVITPTGKVVSHDKEAVGEMQIFEEIKERAEEKAQDVFVGTDNEERFVISYTKAQDSWIIVNTVNEEDVISSVGSMEKDLLLLGFVFAVIAVGIGMLFTFKITNTMKMIMIKMKQAAKGDLTVKAHVNRNDELKILSETFNEMVKQIRELVCQSSKVAYEVNTSSSNISCRVRESTKIASDIENAIHEMAEGACNQSEQVEKIVHLVESLSQKTDLVVKCIEDVNRTSENVQMITNKGIDTTQVLIHKNEDVNEATKEVVKAMNYLGNDMQDIKQIVLILKEISKKIHLLSLNASIEAVRAGEAGKGFSVVANEVNKLADQSTQSTKEIENIIERILVQTQKSMDAVKRAEGINRNQHDAVKSTVNEFAEIKNISCQLNGQIGDILHEVKEMNDFKEKVEEAIHMISSVSQMTAASTEEITASVADQNGFLEKILTDIEILASKADELAASLKDFTVEDI